jgi:hypothetical protein
MLLSPLILYWQFNLFSETFFIALCLIYLSIFLAPIVPHRFFKICLLSIPLMLSRPNGIFIVIIALMLYLYQHKLISKKIMIYSGVCVSIILLTAIVFFMPLPYQDFSFQIARGSIYCGFPTLSATTLPEANYTLWNCYAYIYNTHGLFELFQLFVKKGLSFFVTSRPYYSTFHNVLNRAHDIFYVLGIIGIYSAFQNNKKWLPFLIALFFIVMLNALMVSLIYNEWSERHTVQVFPYIFVGGAYAISLFLEKLRLIKTI